MGISHPDSVGSNNHAITSNPNSSGAPYANIAARDADISFNTTLSNVDKVVRVSDADGSGNIGYFALTSITPAWAEFTSTKSNQWTELIDTPLSYVGQAMKVPRVNVGETALEFSFAGSGDVTGPIPASSTDNSLVRFNGITGKEIQGSSAILSDLGDLSVTTINGVNIKNTEPANDYLNGEGLYTEPANIYSTDGTVIGGIRTYTGESNNTLRFTQYNSDAATFTTGTEKTIGSNALEYSAFLGDGAGNKLGIAEIHIASTGASTGIILINTLTTEGAVYFDDYSAGFVDRSLIDKGFFDSNPSGAAGANTQLQYNNAGALAGISSVFSDGTSLFINDTSAIRFGSGAAPIDLIIAHGGLDGTITATKGDLTFATTEAGADVLIDTNDGSLGINTTLPPDPSSILEMESTTQGLLKPRMSTVQRDLITTPATGLEIYNITNSESEFFDGSSWQSTSGDGDVVGPISSVIDSVPSFSTIDGRNLQDPNSVFINSGNLGIRIPIPVSTLHIQEDTDTLGVNTGVTIENININGEALLHFKDPFSTFTMGMDADDNIFYITPGSSINVSQGLNIDRTTGRVAIGNISGGPNQLYVAGDISVTTGNGYNVQSVEILSATTLGPSVVNSSLTSLGTLTQLNVLGPVGVGTTTPDASSLLELNSTTLGFLPPRMTTVQRDAIVSSATGLEIFNLTTLRSEFFDGSSWLPTAGEETLAQTLVNGNITGGTDLVVSSGDSITTPNSAVALRLQPIGGNVGINTGVQTVEQKLHVSNGSILIENIGNGPGLLLRNELNGIINSTIRLVSTGPGAGYMEITDNQDTPLLFLRGGRVGIGVSNPTPSALLDLTSTTQVFLPPRMTTVQRDAIIGPVTGSEIFNISNGIPEYYNGTNWVATGRIPNVVRTIPVVVNDAVDIGSFTFTQGAASLIISITVGAVSFSTSKEYLLPISFDQSNGVWVTVLPISDTGIFGGNNFDLEVNVDELVTSLRIRRTAGSTAGSALIVIKQEGIVTDVFTPSTATSTVTAPTAFYENSALTQVNNKVGVLTSTPDTELDVNGEITMRTGAVYGHIPVSDPTGKLVWTNPNVVSNLTEVSFSSEETGLQLILSTSQVDVFWDADNWLIKLVSKSASSNEIGWVMNRTGVNGENIVTPNPGILNSQGIFALTGIGASVFMTDTGLVNTSLDLQDRNQEMHLEINLYETNVASFNIIIDIFSRGNNLIGGVDVQAHTQDSTLDNTQASNSPVLYYWKFGNKYLSGTTLSSPYIGLESAELVNSVTVNNPDSTGGNNALLTTPGTSDHMTFTPSVNIGGNTTLDVFVRIDSFNSFDRVVEISNAGGNDSISIEQGTAAGSLLYFHRTALTGNAMIEIDSIFTVGVWTRITVTADSSGDVHVYQDNALILDESTPVGGNIIQNFQSVQIPLLARSLGFISTGTAGSFMDGSTAELRIHNAIVVPT